MGRFRIVPAAQLVIVESLFVVSAATRFYLVLDAIGVVLDPIDSMALAASGSLASTLGIVPGALGVFEALSAGLALIIGLPAGAGLLGAVVLRVLLFGSLLLWSVVLGVRRPGARRR
jgi:Mg2+-importing ATPase